MQFQKTRKNASPNAYILALQLRLLQRALATWPRRGSPLLEVNCGSGQYLQFLWQSGFDVIATEPDPEARRLARAIGLEGLEIHGVSAESLPFEAEYFDWVIIHLKNSGAEGESACIQEGLRVARRGLMLTFWNTFSLAAFLGRFSKNKKSVFSDGHSWFRLWRTLESLGSGRLSTLSTLFLPEAMWKKNTFNKIFNNIPAISPFGAWCLIKLDLGPMHPVTPLALRLDRKMASPTPALEYSREQLTRHTQP